MAFRHAIVDEMLSSATRTSSGVSSGFNKNDLYEGLVLAKVTAASGTNPTLAIKVETSPDNATWFDLPGGAFAQITGAGQYALKIDNFGKYIRLAYTLGGTNPSFTFSVHFVGKT